MSYDPRFHSSVVRNLRPQLPQKLSDLVGDEDIWDVWETSTMYDYEDDAEHVKLFIELLKEMYER